LLRGDGRVDGRRHSLQEQLLDDVRALHTGRGRQVLDRERGRNSDRAIGRRGRARRGLAGLLEVLLALLEEARRAVEARLALDQVLLAEDPRRRAVPLRAAATTAPVRHALAAGALPRGT